METSNKEQTNVSFINHSKLGRLYKTGDLGRWHRDVYIEFMGRKDNQVKLNGYRVELEEISAKLAKLEGVDEAIVKIQKEDGRDYVIGYLLPKNNKQNYQKTTSRSRTLKNHSSIKKLLN